MQVDLSRDQIRLLQDVLRVNRQMAQTFLRPPLDREFEELLGSYAEVEHILSKALTA